ncbi:MAG: hypothetical protein JWN25_3648 [Verrucomicrobiales bacterium]|nr:hypothetical protein [Verrucomicrobiales bacterium]
MGSSLQSYKNKYVRFHDGDLTDIILLSKSLISNRVSEFSDVIEVVNNWNSALERSGPGTLDLKLDKDLSDPNVKSRIVGFLEALKNEIGHYGVTIPSVFMNGLNPPNGTVYLGDPDVRHIQDTISSLQDLLESKDSLPDVYWVLP